MAAWGGLNTFYFPSLLSFIHSWFSALYLFCYKRKVTEHKQIFWICLKMKKDCLPNHTIEPEPYFSCSWCAPKQHVREILYLSMVYIFIESLFVVSHLSSSFEVIFASSHILRCDICFCFLLPRTVDCAKLKHRWHQSSCLLTSPWLHLTNCLLVCLFIHFKFVEKKSFLLWDFSEHREVLLFWMEKWQRLLKRVSNTQPISTFSVRNATLHPFGIFFCQSESAFVFLWFS